MAIVISGSVAFDYLMTFPGYFRENILPDKLDKISLSFLVDNMTRQRGGCAVVLGALAPVAAWLHATCNRDGCTHRKRKK